MKRKSVRLQALFRSVAAVAALCLLLAPCILSARTVRAESAPSDYVKIYESGTKMLNAPTVLSEIKGESDLSLLNGAAAPSTVLVNVDGDLTVLYADGLKFEPLEAFAARLNKKSALAVRVASVAAGGALADWAKEGIWRDLFVVAPSSEILSAALGGYAYMYGVLDLRGQSGVNASSASVEAMRAGARILLSDYGAFSYAENRRLRALQFSSWTEASGAEQTVHALYEGYIGLIAPDPAATYAVLEAYDQKAIYDTSVVVGHRGSSGVYPENSVEAALYAVEQGANAVEYDIHLTLDRRVVIMHDEDIQTTTDGSGKVKEMTLEQIRAYHLVSSSGATAKIPTLDDMFEAFARDPDTVHYVEYKANDVEIIPYVKALIEKYDMAGRVVFLSFFANVLEQSRAVMPEIPVGQLYGNFGGRDYYADLNKTVTEFNALFKSNHCVYSDIIRQYIEVARHRGIAVNGWTFVGEESYYRHFAMGMTSVTVDNPEKIGELPVRVEAKDLTVKAGEAFTPSGKVVTASKTFEGNCTLAFVGGGKEDFTYANGSYIPAKAGEYTVVLLYQYARAGYYAASDAFTLTVEAQGEINGAPSDSPDGTSETNADKKGCGGAAGAASVGVALASCGAAIIFALKNRRGNKA